MNATGHYEPCEECGSPMDAQQRYCVNCAARRGNGANPSSRYFAAMSKRARRPLSQPGQRPASGSRAAAVGFFALLPIAVAIGVVVGRAGAGNGDEAALLQALREGHGSAVATSAPPSHGPAARKADAKGKKGAQAKSSGSGKVVATPPMGRSIRSPASSPAGRRKKRTPSWSKKTPRRRAPTTSRRSRTFPTWSWSAAIPAKRRRCRPGRASHEAAHEGSAAGGALRPGPG
jgi:hypothetical protein